jgi:hypothetical protein
MSRPYKYRKRERQTFTFTIRYCRHNESKCECMVIFGGN